MSNTLNHSQPSTAPRGLRVSAVSAVRRVYAWLTTLVSQVLFAGEPMAVVWDDAPPSGVDGATGRPAKHRVGRRRTTRIRLRVQSPSDGRAPLVIPAGSFSPSTRRTPR